MLTILAKLATAGPVKHKIDQLVAHCLVLGLATISGLFALRFVLDAVREGLATQMPGWAASLTLGASLLVVAALLLIIGKRSIRRRNADAASLSGIAPLMVVAPKLASLVRRHPVEIVLTALAAISLLGKSRRRGDT